MKAVIQLGNELKKVSLSEALENTSAIQYAGTDSQCDTFMNIAH
jgi:hypothetical protein